MTGEHEALPFSKLEALGNDFMLVDARSMKFAPGAGAVRAWSDRRRGVGFDQLLVLRPPERHGHHCRVEILNADGSEAEQCGNGMRAVVLWLRTRREIDGAVRLETAAGTVEASAHDDDAITATLGVPDFSRQAVGLAGSGGFPWPVTIDGESLSVHGASLGNPHLLVVEDSAPTPDRLQQVGPALGKHRDLASGANVSLTAIESPHRIHLRVFERGAGPTEACGSGAGAAAAILMRLERVKTPVEVVQPGGTLVVDWRGPGESITTTGPARRVYEGVTEWPTQSL